MRRFDHHRLHELTCTIITAGGSAEGEARLVADQLVGANLTGHDSHGVGILPFYVESLAKGALVPNRAATVVTDQGPVLVVEGQRGYGQVIGHQAMSLGAERAKTMGVALVATRNSFHMGRIGHWAEQCAAAGCASIHFVNGVDHPPLQATFGAAEARISTNPFCAALPGRDGPAVLLDMATSKIAVGKARVAMNTGVPTPPDCVLDDTGQPTRDGGVMFRDPQGVLLAMGEHKGSGLAIMCELLAGALTGGWTLRPEHPQKGGSINNMLSVIIDPNVFGDPERLLGEAEAMIAHLRSARPRAGFDEVLVPGDPERRARKQRLAEGIEVDPRTLDELVEAARAVGVTDDRIAALLAPEEAPRSVGKN